jgi:hypothetical protein
VPSIRSPRTAGRRPGARRSLRLALVAATAALAAGALAAPAGAALSAVGPVNPATGFPDWYQDGTGLKLQPCLDGPPFCLTAASELVAPDGEGFWWQAEAALPLGTAGNARLVLAQEAAFLDNARISFGRVRITVTGARANTTYNFNHPYGSASVTTDGLGNGRFNSDIGCAAAPCDWAAALGGAFTDFLRWNPAVPPAAPAGFIGDAATPHAVTGGSVRNTFSFNGAGLTGATTQFTVSGKLAGPPVPVIEAPQAADFGATQKGAPVARTINITSFGVPDPAGRSNLLFGPIGIAGPQASAFQLVGNNCSGRAIPSGQSCQLTIQMNPVGNGNYQAALNIAHNSAEGATGIALTGVVGSAGTAGAGARGRLRVRSLRTTHRLSRAQVLRRGIRLTMRLPQGTEIVKFSVLRVRGNGRVDRKPIWLAYRVAPSRAGLWRVRLDSRALRRRMKAGLYQLNVTPGVSRRELGRTSTTRIRVTRR